MDKGDKIMRQIFKKLFVLTVKVLVLGCLIGLLIGNTMVSGYMASTLGTLSNKIEIYEQQRNELLVEVAHSIADLADYTLENDRSQNEISKIILNKVIDNTIKVDNIRKEQITVEEDFEVVKSNVEEKLKVVESNVDKIAEVQKKYEGVLKNIKTIDIENIDDIKGANVLIYNITANTFGSGTHIKINEKSYILTCAHLVKNQGDELWADVYSLELVRLDVKRDLALYAIDCGDLIPYLEVSDVAPKEGSEVLVIGNPDLIDDMITDGIVAKMDKGYYIVTNKIYFGSSGGAVLYKGKIVGVVTKFRVMFTPPMITNCAEATNLASIQELIRSIK